MKATILAERLKRQRLILPLRRQKDYLPLFRMLQPVSPVAYSYPGSPPGLVHRTTFDHKKAADKLRAGRTIVKGRFLGGGIGYVCADDLAVYATAFRKPVKGLNYIQQMVLEIVNDVGPLSPRQIKEESKLIEDLGLLNKEIMPALHRMQEAFLVFEDPPDTDWERNWCGFEAEWPDIDFRFGGEEVLQYLLIDGEFAGAVLGHWRIGPHDVDDILIELPAKQRSARKAEIMDAVAWNYHPPHHQILAYE